MKRIFTGLLTALLLLSCFSVWALAAEDAAAGYKDAEKISHAEAVQVLSDLEILAGYEDGYFYPAKPVTRAEMAKMICSLLDPEKDSYSHKTASFHDMEGHWAQEYVQACYERGIVSGKNASTFDPNATVTGVEASKMLLVVLGYDPLIEGFTGSVTWEATVLKAARQANLFSCLEGTRLATPLTRDEAAQMILNALDAEIVYYDFQIDPGRAEGDPLYNAFRTTTGQKLYEQRFNGILQKSSSQDASGNTSIHWTVCK